MFANVMDFRSPSPISVRIFMQPTLTGLARFVCISSNPSPPSAWTSLMEAPFIVLQMGEGGTNTVSYPYFVAFISLLNNIELIKKIYLNATNGSRTLEITKGSVTNAYRFYTETGRTRTKLFFLTFQRSSCIQPR